MVQINTPSSSSGLAGLPDQEKTAACQTVKREQNANILLKISA
jgi:hypothetical protein